MEIKKELLKCAVPLPLTEKSCRNDSKKRSMSVVVYVRQHFACSTSAGKLDAKHLMILKKLSHAAHPQH